MMSVKSSHLWFKLAEQRPNKAITSQSALVMTPLPRTHHSPADRFRAASVTAIRPGPSNMNSISCDIPDQIGI